MLKLTTFAAIAREHSVSFEVQFTHDESFAVLVNHGDEYGASKLTVALLKAGALCVMADRRTRWYTLESLT